MFMDFKRFLPVLILIMASTLIILILCVFAIQRPTSTGVWIPMMRTRDVPLSNCEFNGFTVYLRSDGKLAGGTKDEVISRNELLSRIRETQGNIQDDTIFVITDPDVPYGEFASLIADIHNMAPTDHIAVVTRDGQIQAMHYPSRVPFDEAWADRCRFVWPALSDQPKHLSNEHQTLQ